MLPLLILSDRITTLLVPLLMHWSLSEWSEDRGKGGGKMEGVWLSKRWRISLHSGPQTGDRTHWGEWKQFVSLAEVWANVFSELNHSVSVFPFRSFAHSLVWVMAKNHFVLSDGVMLLPLSHLLLLTNKSEAHMHVKHSWIQAPSDYSSCLSDQG